MFSVVVLASGGGGNLRAILDHPQHSIVFHVVKVLCDRKCGALEVAREFGIQAEIFNSQSVDSYLSLISPSTKLVVLAGFMPIVPVEFCKKFEGRIINTHPSLLPKYGGKGMYGVKVQEAVISGNESFAGCTVHYVTSGIDEGPIIDQLKVRVPNGINAWDLGGMVFKLESRLLPEVISKLAAGALN